MLEIVGRHGASDFENGFSIKGDGYSGGGEECGAAGVTEEANGNQGSVIKSWKKMICVGRLGKGRDDKNDKMSGLYDGVVGKRDNKEKLGNIFVGVVGRDREEVNGAACARNDGQGEAYVFSSTCSV